MKEDGSLRRPCPVCGVPMSIYKANGQLRKCCGRTCATKIARAEYRRRYKDSIKVKGTMLFLYHRLGLELPDVRPRVFDRSHDDRN